MPFARLEKWMEARCMGPQLRGVRVKETQDEQEDTLNATYGAGLELVQS
jgi:hypothetical protein